MPYLTALFDYNMIQVTRTRDGKVKGVSCFETGRSNKQYISEQS